MAPTHMLRSFRLRVGTVCSHPRDPSASPALTMVCCFRTVLVPDLGKDMLISYEVQSPDTTTGSLTEADKVCCVHASCYRLT